MSEFNSRQQYNKVTQSISKIFDIKLSKVRHKYALDKGYKNSNAYESTLMDETMDEIVFDPCYLEFTLDNLPDSYLEEIIVFDKLVNWYNGEMMLNRIKAPRAIKLMMEGSIFKTDKWLHREIFHFRKNQDRTSNEYWEEKPFMAEKQGYNCNDDEFGFIQDLDKKHGFSKIPLIVFQTLVNESYVVKDEKYLLSNLDILESLVSGGSTAQYNYFCKNKKILKSFNEALMDKLGRKYLFQLDMRSSDLLFEFESFEEEFCNTLMSCGFGIPNSKDAEFKSFVQYELPPAESLTSRLDSSSYGDKVENHLLGGYFPISDMGYAKESPYLDFYFSLMENINTKDYLPSVYEKTFLKHANFAFDYYLKVLLLGGDRLEDHTLYIKGTLNFLIYLDIDLNNFNQLMLMKLEMEEVDDCKYYNEDSWVIKDSPFIVYYIIYYYEKIEKYNQETCHKKTDEINMNQLQLLFKLLSEEVLNSKVELCNLKLKEHKPELLGVKTVSDLLKISLKCLSDKVKI